MIEKLYFIFTKKIIIKKNHDKKSSIECYLNISKEDENNRISQKVKQIYLLI